MNLPKFSAEASPGPSTGHYVGINRLDSTNKAGMSQRVEPQSVLIFWVVTPSVTNLVATRELISTSVV